MYEAYSTDLSLDFYYSFIENVVFLKNKWVLKKIFS